MKKFLASSWVVPVGTFLILFVSCCFVWPMVPAMTQQQLDLVGMLTGVSVGVWLAMVVKWGIGRVSIETGLWGINHVMMTWLVLIPYGVRPGCAGWRTSQYGDGCNCRPDCDCRSDNCP